MGRLDGKVAIITGSNSGVGAATAKLFAKDGYNLVLVARSEEKLYAIKNDLESKYNIKTLVIVIDKKPYVDMDTCVLATHIINPILDEKDLIDDSYYLEVCSKGVD